jgi:cytidylate kinase
MGRLDAGIDTEAGASEPREWSARLLRWFRNWRREVRAAGDQSVRKARFRIISVSREAGAGGGTLARRVGTRLGWKVYDHELLEAIGRRMEVSLEEARTYDELAPSVIHDWLLPLGEEHYAPHEAYLDHLAKLVEAIGRSGDSVVVGRGAGFLLPREETLSIRVVAPLRFRAQRLAERMGVSHRTARRAARDMDRRASRFTRVMYHADVADPHHYDLVLDTHSLGFEIATAIVVRAIEAGRPAHGDREEQEKHSEPTQESGLE